jgi:hypothetical protein
MHYNLSMVTDTVLSSALVLYRRAADRGNLIARAQFVEIVNAAYDASVLRFPALRSAPAAHTFQRTRVIEVASKMLERAS